MNARNTSSRGVDYTRCSLRRGREREVQSRATSVTASSISPRAWAGVRNRAFELSRCLVDAERKRELRETRAWKVTFLRFSPSSCSGAGIESGSPSSRREWSTCTTSTWQFLSQSCLPFRIIVLINRKIKTKMKGVWIVVIEIIPQNYIISPKRCETR